MKHIPKQPDWLDLAILEYLTKHGSVPVSKRTLYDMADALSHDSDEIEHRIFLLRNYGAVEQYQSSRFGCDSYGRWKHGWRIPDRIPDWPS